VLVGVGSIGQKIVERARRSLDETSELLRVVSEPTQTLRERFIQTLDPLLRAGRRVSSAQGRRLDVLAFASALQGTDDELVGVCDALSRAIGGNYPAIFPPNSHPEQRTATLHLVVAVPALARSDPARRALGRLLRVERWAGGEVAYPLLSRVWLVAPQTTAGTLSIDEVVATCAHFAVITIGSGLRDEGPIRERMEHTGSERGLFGFLALASLDIPEAGLRRYASARASLDALGALVARVERQGDAGLGEGALHRLGLSGESPLLEDDPVSQKFRKVAWQLSGGASRLPERIGLGPFDTPEEVRNNYPELFRPATTQRVFTGQDKEDLSKVLAELDDVESAAQLEWNDRLRQLFATTCAQRSGLRDLSNVEAGLRRLLFRLRDEEGRASIPVVPDAGDPLREELEAALLEMPSRAMVHSVSAAVGMAVGLLVALGALSYATPTAAAPSGISRPTIPGGTAALSAPGLETVAPWVVGLVVGALVAIAFAHRIGHRTRRDVQALLERRRDALDALKASGAASSPTCQADAQLALRRRRLRRSARGGLERTLAHMEAIRRSLVDARIRQQQRLVDMGVKLGADASLDDVSALMGASDNLHGWLVSAPRLARWASSRRQWPDPELWADRFLAETWPPRGLEDDVPCADDQAVERAGNAQIKPLLEQSLFGDPTAAQEAGENARQFIHRVSMALAPPGQPRDQHGDPVKGHRGEEIIAVGPAAGREVLVEALSVALVAVKPLWTQHPAPRLLFLRTWEGFHLHDIARGAGLIETGSRNGGGAGDRQ